MPERLLDELRVAALIEARSCERMALLAAEFAAADAALAAFYRDLVLAEERHHEVYVGIALALADADAVASRFGALAAHEAAVLAELPWSPRLHGGVAREAPVG
jgi:tRNA-(ms[2]io[6]A)-hydroxylase